MGSYQTTPKPQPQQTSQWQATPPPQPTPPSQPTPPPQPTSVQGTSRQNSDRFFNIIYVIVHRGFILAATIGYNNLLMNNIAGFNIVMAVSNYRFFENPPNFNCEFPGS